MKVRNLSYLVQFRKSYVLFNASSDYQQVLLMRRSCGPIFRVLRHHSSSTSPSKEEDAAPSVEAESINTPLASRLKAAALLIYEIARSTGPAMNVQIPPSVSNLADYLSRGKQTPEPNPPNPPNPKGNQDKKPNGVDWLPLYLAVLGKETKTKPAEEKIARWRVKRMAVSQESIDARSRHVVSAISRSTSVSSLAVRLDDFCNHLFQYPQSKSLATREGAVPLLLRLQRHHPLEPIIQEDIREALALLGHTESLPARGVRILSIDGGGTRGLLALRILRHLEEKLGQPIHESFDYICGVSTGAILAILIGAHKKSLSEVEELYRKMSQDVFRQDRSAGLSGLLWSHAYYDTDKWEKILKDHIGETPMIKTARGKGVPKVSAVSSVVNRDVARPYIFRNYTLPHRSQSSYNGSFRHRCWEAVRATSAAPGYFGEFRLEDNIHQDGGLLVNNPTAVAVHEAKCIWPDAHLLSVVSIGTGRSQPNDLAARIDGAAVNVTASDFASTSWKQKLVKLIDSATDTERVHTLLHDLLPPKVYYRLNPYLNQVHGLDETDPMLWKRMLEDVDMYIRKNQAKLSDAACSLKSNRTAYQNVQDWVDHQKVFLKNPPLF